MAYHVGKARFAELVEEALNELPAQFQDLLEEVAVEIRDVPTRRQIKSVGVRRDGLLLGLYVGISRIDRSVEHSGVMPDVIYIFQQHIEMVCHSEKDLKSEVRKTVLHEIGHHFGLGEDELDDLGYG